VSASVAIIGTSTVIRHVQHLVTRVAELDTPVLVTGETGTGRTLVARAIHEKSARSAGRFVVVKSAAFTEDMLEIELFGIVPEGGAARQGHLEAARGGTVYIDDIAKVGPRIQAALVRAISEGVLTPVGSDRPVPVNARIMCATVHSPDDLVRDRVLREDLYYRLAQCSVYLPPLRDRREDIPSLVEFFVERFNREKHKGITGASPDALTALLQHDWTNNVRELENLIERIVVLKNSGSIEVCDLPPRLRNFVTDNIDSFYNRTPRGNPQPQQHQQQPQQHQQQRSPQAPQQQRSSNSAPYTQPNFHTPTMSHHMNEGGMGGSKLNNFNMPSSMSYGSQNISTHYGNQVPGTRSYEDASDIDLFIKKELDLGNGIDFYRIVEEFENRLIAEALRRTNHNKNRAAQLLSMNRTTLVEKLKKRTTSTSSKTESHRVKRNSAFTIFDSLGNEDAPFANDYISGDDAVGIIDVE
jgi:DNA-binding NtrC family response regulator